MAIDFPDGYDISEAGSRIQRVSGARSDEAVDGTIRFLDLGEKAFYHVTAVVAGMTESEMDTLLDWLEDNETEEIDVPIGTRTYRGKLKPGSAPQANRIGGVWRLAFSFKGERI